LSEAHSSGICTLGRSLADLYITKSSTESVKIHFRVNLRSPTLTDMARMTSNPSGGSAVPVPVISNAAVIEQLDVQIYRAMKDFHYHSKDCKVCRNPVRVYQDNRDLCSTGRELSVTLSNALYKKAEYVPNGRFTVEYKQGWEAVDGLIRIICHFNQGFYDTQIVDLKRITPRPAAERRRPALEEAPRGSQYEEDMRRREAAARGSRRTQRGPIYGDPRTSYLDAPTGQSQAEISPASSSRSVHFDSRIRVLEFDED
jgi:hypothetical protein